MRERIVRVVAGSVVLISVALAYFANINWLWLGVFVGINLVQSSFTKFCPLEKYWMRLKLNTIVTNGNCLVSFITRYEFSITKA